MSHLLTILTVSDHHARMAAWDNQLLIFQRILKSDKNGLKILFGLASMDSGLVVGQAQSRFD